MTNPPAPRQRGKVGVKLSDRDKLAAAAARLYEECGPTVNGDVQAIGVGVGRLFIYLKRKSRAEYPIEFDGYPVDVVFVGRVKPAAL